MAMTESKLRRIIKEEAVRLLRNRGGLREAAGLSLGRSAAEEDGAGRWVVGDEGYTLSDAPRDVAEAWYNFTVAVSDLEEFMNDTYPDTEADGKPLTVGDAAVHQAKTFLTER